MQRDTEVAVAELRARLTRDAKADDRQIEVRAVLDRYRKPLAASADDLRSRITNLRRHRFAFYFKEEGHRSEMAKLSTLYRFAAYFGWIETLSRELTYLPFETDEDTREVAALLGEIDRTFTNDSLDRIDSLPRLMLWREEQRAVGGLMQRTDGVPGVIGFETAVEKYEPTFSRWLNAFLIDLEVPAAISGDRLRDIDRTLNELIPKLDVEGIYIGKSNRRPRNLDRVL